MKKLFAVFLALVLACSCLAGCGNSNGTVSFDTLSLTLQDGKTLEMGMDQDTVREIMVDAPYNTIDLDTTVYDEWPIDYGLFVSYGANNKVNSIFTTGSHEFSTSLGISTGDSAEKLKEKLGKPMKTTDNNDLGTGYFYYFYLTDGRYQIIRESLEDFNTNHPDGANLYYANIYIRDDTVASFAAYDLSD